MGTELAHYCYAHPAGGEREGEAVENCVSLFSHEMCYFGREVVSWIKLLTVKAFF